MRKVEEIGNLSPSKLVDLVQEMDAEIAIAASEVADIEKELVAADAAHREMSKQAKLVRAYCLAMVRTSDPEKREKVRAKYMAALTKNFLKHQKVQASLVDSRATVDKAIDGLEDVIKTAAENVMAKMKDVPEVIDLGTHGAIISPKA